MNSAQPLSCGWQLRIFETSFLMSVVCCSTVWNCEWPKTVNHLTFRWRCWFDEIAANKRKRQMFDDISRWAKLAQHSKLNDELKRHGLHIVCHWMTAELPPTLEVSQCRAVCFVRALHLKLWLVSLPQNRRQRCKSLCWNVFDEDCFSDRRALC